MSQGAIVLPVRTVAIGVAIVLAFALLAALLAVPGTREAILRVTDPRATAAPASLDLQRTATERSIQRGYAKATGQLAEVRKLTLAISASQAAAITDRALADLKTIRRDALGAVGVRLGYASPQLEQYVANAEAQLGDNAFANDAGVLLAPDLYTVVARADDLFQRAADAATRELTRAPGVNPTVSPSPTASPTPSPSPTR